MLIANGIDGTAPYTFEWFDSMNNLLSYNDTLDSVCPGSYSVNITDANGCLTSGNRSISEPLSIIITLDLITNVSENGFSDGAIHTTSSGGNGTYTYSWSGPNGYTSINDDILKKACR